MRISIFLFISFNLIAMLCTGQCYTLKGKVINASSNQVLSASFSIKNGVRKILVGKSDSRGLFSIELPCNSVSLIIEQPGFRTVEMPLSGNEGSYYFELGLHPVDKQINDRPYFQSEQKDIVLNNADFSQAGKMATRIFKLIDIQTKAPIKGEVCLYFTKTGEKQCFISDKDSKESIIHFKQEDIIGVVVHASDYQYYNGNLIIDKLENSSSIYEIGLSKVISIISFSYKPTGPSPKVKFELADLQGESVPIIASDNLGYALVKTDESYVLKVKSSNGLTLQTSPQVKVHGLSFLTISPGIKSQAQSATQVQLASPPLLSKSENISDEWADKTIYFKQSTYDLTFSAKQTLDSVATWLNHKRILTVLLTGFTDNIGDPQKNLTLSEFRAKVTRKYLIDKGVNETQIQIRALGGKSPAGSNEKEETKTLNRRVEIKFYLKNQDIQTKVN